MSKDWLTGMKGPFIVFPHKNLGRPMLVGKLDKDMATKAEVIIDIDRMEVIKNRAGPTGTLSTHVSMRGSTKEKILEKIENMKRTGKWV